MFKISLKNGNKALIKKNSVKGIIRLAFGHNDHILQRHIQKCFQIGEVVR